MILKNKKELRGDETYRRSIKKTQRDHRKTHVIRPEDTLAARAEILPELPAFESRPLGDISNDSPSSAICFASPLALNKAKPKKNASSITQSAITAYVSPFPNSPNSSVVETPFDDKEKDPDWGPSRDNEKDWANTPVGAAGMGKRRSKLGIKNVSRF